MAETTFAERLKRLITEGAITQSDLARRARITEAALSRYLNDGRVPRMDVVANLATVLGTTTDYLLGRVAEPDGEMEFCGIKRLVARGAGNMTHDEKMELVDIIFGRGN